MTRDREEADGETGGGSPERSDRTRGDTGGRSARIRTLHRQVGNQAVQGLHREGALGGGLRVSDPGDAEEREARRVADAVVEGGRAAVVRGTDGGIARRVDGAAIQREPAGASGSAAGGATYTVERGDSLWGIAERFDVDGGHQRLAELNDMAVDDPIHPGDTLTLPGGSVREGGSGGSGDGGATGSAGDGGPDASGGAAGEGEGDRGQSDGGGGSGWLSLWNELWGTDDEQGGEGDERGGDGTKEGMKAVIRRTIREETEAYRNLTVSLGEDRSVSVEAQYFMNTDDRAAAHAQSEWQDMGEWGKRTFTGSTEEVANELQSHADSQFRGSVGNTMEMGTAVEVGKASPDVLEAFIQEAVDQGAVQEFTGVEDLTALEPEAARQHVQTYVNEVGIGVDCSGLVTHMITEIRREVLGGEGSGGEDPRVNSKSAQGYAGAPEVATPAELRPGDVMVNSGRTHVRMVFEVTGPTGDGYAFRTVESASRGGLSDSRGRQNRAKDNVLTETHTAEGPETFGSLGGTFHRPEALDF